jgi:hypothetical protein
MSGLQARVEAVVVGLAADEHYPMRS